MTKLAFTRLGPAPAPAVAVPPPAVQLADHVLAYDPTRRALVYGTSPDYHKVGHAWTLDDDGFHRFSSKTHRLGSQNGPWRAVYDAGRKAVVAWSYDYPEPRGVILGEKPTAIATSGDPPTIPEDATWSDLSGLFGFDARRGVTVCLTQGGVYELSGARWARIAAPPKGLPGDVDGMRGPSNSGAGAAWDAVRGEVVFWMHDQGKGRACFFAWNGAAWRPVAGKGLPASLCSSSSDDGIAVGDHPEHGVVIHAGARHGLFGRTATGWRSLGAADGAPRASGRQLAHDAARGVLVLGPYETDDGEQNVFHELRDGRWRALGNNVTPSVLADMSGGATTFARHHGVVHVADAGLRTMAWNPSGDGGFWREVVAEDATAAVKKGARMDALVSAWDGALHAVMNDGSVLVLDKIWKPRSRRASTWKDPSSALVAFDPRRRVLVAWGPRSPRGVRRPITQVFDGATWTHVKQTKDKPADGADDLDNAALYFDTARGMVARLGKTELAHFDGATWQVTPLQGSDRLETWRRCVCHDPATGTTVVVNCGEKTVVRLAGNKIVPAGKLAAPVRRDADENLPFDQWWFDDAALALVVHNEVDDRQTFSLDLRPAFGR